MLRSRRLSEALGRSATMWLVACRAKSGAMPRLAELEGERALFVYNPGNIWFMDHNVRRRGDQLSDI